MAGEPIEDGEVLLRRIPPGETWLEPHDRLTSANFKLDTRKAERGLSVYRQRFVTAPDVLRKPGAISGSRVAFALAGQVRRMRARRMNP